MLSLYKKFRTESDLKSTEPTVDFQTAAINASLEKTNRARICDASLNTSPTTIYSVPS